LDFTIAGGKQKSDAVINMVEALGKEAGIDLGTLNEYTRKTKGGTANHIHVHFKSKKDAQTFGDFYKNKKEQQRKRQEIERFVDKFFKKELAKFAIRDNTKVAE